MGLLLEVCVDTVGGLMAAVRGGADRIELCAALSVGGLTPSPGLMVAASAVDIPVYPLIRPRAGGFFYSDAEVSQMCADILAARATGMAGVVIGAARADGTLDLAALERMIDAAEGMDLTLHRVFDLVPDRGAALEQAVALGFTRILTSGAAQTALQGKEALLADHQRAAGRIGILPGGGIAPDNLGKLLEGLAVAEVHASCSAPVGSSDKERALGFAGAGLKDTDEARVRDLKRLLGAH